MNKQAPCLPGFEACWLIYKIAHQAGHVTSAYFALAHVRPNGALSIVCPTIEIQLIEGLKASNGKEL